MAAGVVTHSADEDHVVPETPGMDREIEWGAAQTFRIGEDIPENLADADND